MTHHSAASSTFHKMHSSLPQHGAHAVKSPSQQVVGRDEDRRENAALMERKFRAPSQADRARMVAEFLNGEVTDRTVINWLQEKHDMPAWAFKRIAGYVSAVERLARRIEG